MARINHIALKVENLESATRFYEDVFGFRQTSTGHARGHVSRHMTDGEFDVALMVYDNEEVHEARLSGSGPCIHHWGIEVEDRNATMALIETNGGEIISKPGEGALKFRAPNGTVAEIVAAGRYRRYEKPGPSRVVRLAIKVADLDASAQFYEKIFGFVDVRTEREPWHVSRHLTDGKFDLVLMAFRDGDAEGPLMPGPLSRIHSWGIAVPEPKAIAGKIAAHGGSISSGPDAATLELRAPDGTLIEIMASEIPEKVGNAMGA